MPSVLVVDDEAALRATIAANLELEGFDVVEAADAIEALARVAERPFDVVLTDIRMPGMNGVDLFREIRRLQPDLPVLLMTAFALEGVVQDALREGAFMVMPKPFDIEHLIRGLGSALHRPVILVVDDLPAVAESTAAALHSLGLPARAVTSGAQALDVIAAGDIGVCVVDLVMPEIDGPDLMAQIRARDPAVVFIAFSGYDLDEMFRRAARYAFTILRKPVAPSDLVSAIARARIQATAAR